MYIDYINIEDGHPKPNENVEAICNNGGKYEVYHNRVGEWRDSETDHLMMINIEKWKYV